MSVYFLIGSILGSGAFIFLGGPPARRLARAAQQWVRR